MIVYKIYSNIDQYAHLRASNQKNRDVFDNFYHLPLQTTWKKIPLKMTKGELGDFVGIVAGTVLGINTDKCHILQPLIDKEEIELLELDVKESDVHAINIVCISDALDKENTVLEMLAEDRILFIDDHSFQASKLENVYLFKIENFEHGSFFATDTFKKIIDNHQLTGLIFEEVWRSEEN